MSEIPEVLVANQEARCIPEARLTARCTVATRRARRSWGFCHQRHRRDGHCACLCVPCSRTCGPATASGRALVLALANVRSMARALFESAWPLDRELLARCKSFCCCVRDAQKLSVACRDAAADVHWPTRVTLVFGSISLFVRLVLDGPWRGHCRWHCGAHRGGLRAIEHPYCGCSFPNQRGAAEVGRGLVQSHAQTHGDGDSRHHSQLVCWRAASIAAIARTRSSLAG